MKKYFFTLATFLSGSFLTVLASTRQSQMMPPPLPLGYSVQKQSFGEIILNYVYMFFGAFLPFAQVIIVVALLYTLYRMYITKTEVHLGFKKIAVTVLALLYPLFIILWILSSFLSMRGIYSSVILIVQLVSSSFVFFAQLIIISYLLRKLYRMYVTKVEIYGGLKKIAITIFALLYITPIISFLVLFYSRIL